MSKLSRSKAKRNETKKPPSALNDSASDFSSFCTPVPLPTQGAQPTEANLQSSGGRNDGCPSQSTSAQTVEKEDTQERVPRSAIFEETVEEAVDECVQTTVCPVCGKVGVTGSHVKTCGARHGLKGAGLIEAVKLVERQGRERRALGLPLAPVQEKPSKPKSGKSKSVKRPLKKDDDGGVDPDLAVAMALSISEEQHRLRGAGEEVVVSKYFVGGDFDRKSSEKEIAVQGSHGDKVEARMWLPQVSSSPVKKKKRGKRKEKETTVLQLRTDEERSRLLGDRVSETLVEVPTVQSRRPLGTCRQFLKIPQFWRLPAQLDIVSNKGLIARGLVKYLTPADEVHELENKEMIPQNPLPSCSLASLSSAWLSLLKSGAGTDTVMVCKGEAELCCHSLVLNTRAPRILCDAILETSEDGKAKQMLILSNYEASVLQLLLKFIYGGVLDCDAVTSRESLSQVEELARKWGLTEVVKWLEQVEVQEEETTEDPEEGREGDGFAIGKVVEEVEEEEQVEDQVAGTQCLDALLNHLEEENQNSEKVGDNDDMSEVEMEEWDSVCQYMTQRVRNSIVEEKSDSSDEDTQSLTEESCAEVLESEQVDSNVNSTDTASERVGCEGEPQPGNSSDKENNSPPGSKKSSATILKPIPCFAVLERSTTLNSPVQSTSAYLNNDHSLSVVGRRSISTPQVLRDSSKTYSQPVCPPSPDMFDSEEEGESQVSNEVEEIEKERGGFSELAVDAECFKPLSQKDFNKRSSLKRKSINDEETEPKRLKSEIVTALNKRSFQINEDLSYCEDLPTPTKYSPFEKHNSPPSSPCVPSPTSTYPGQAQDPLVDLTQSSTSSTHNDEVDSLEIPTPTRYSPLPLSSNSSRVSSTSGSGTDNKAPPHPAAASSNEGSTLASEDEEEDELLSELSYLTTRLSAVGAPEDEISSCLICLLQLEVTVPALMVSGAGKVVKKLKKEREGEVGELATTLFLKWTRIVEERTEGLERTSDQVQEELEKTGLYDHGEAVLVKKEYEGNSDGDEVCSVKSSTENDAHLGGKPGGQPDFEPSPKFEVEDQPKWEDPPTQPDSPDPEKEVCPLKMGDSPPPWDDPPTIENHDNYGNHDLENPELWNSFNHHSRSESPPRDPQPPHLPNITPVDRRLTSLRRREDTCTPLPDYSSMLSPQLRAELSKFGLKVVPRRKATLLLNHIYEKTHPLVAITPQRPASPLSSRRRSLVKASARRISTTVTGTNAHFVSEKSKEPKRRFKNHTGEKETDMPLAEEQVDSDEGSQASSQASQYSEAGLAEESLLEGEEEEVELSLDQQLSSFIRTRPSLHQQVLEYEPLWLHKFHQDIKEAGVKCNLAQVQQYLDLHCICFRTETKRPNRQKSSPRKKRSPVKKRTPKKKSPKKKTQKPKPPEAGPSVTPLRKARTVATSSKPKSTCLITP